MTPNRLFVYGILKRGHVLDLRLHEAEFLGDATIENTRLYHIGSGVGMRPERGFESRGEVWEIPDHLWDWLDSIEANGFTYTRKLVDTKFGVAWAYFHTFPGMDYTFPIESGEFEIGGEG